MKNKFIQSRLYLKQMLEPEINSVTDNPVVFDETHTINGGNFHGQPIAMPLDYACLAASEIGNISDRRIYLSLEGDTPGDPQIASQRNRPEFRLYDSPIHYGSFGK
ncbi:aromatic amino acid lyase [Fontibacter flavus]|uniref:Aromatic amino acid lyase n=1 Tax=Fontibacter flavus TaxID=654838 RepID=A0ABV6FT10_9BACT